MTKRFNNYEELANAHNDLLDTCEALMNIIQNLVPTCQKLISIYEKINLIDEADYYGDEINYDDVEVDYYGNATVSSDDEADLMIALNEILKSEYQNYINDKDQYCKYLFDNIMDENHYKRLVDIADSRQMPLLELINIDFVIDKNGDSLIDHFTSLKSDHDSYKITYNNNEVGYDSNATDYGDDEADFMMMVNKIPKSAYENYINDRKNYLEYILDIMDNDTFERLKNIASSHEMDLYQFIIAEMNKVID